MRSDERGDAAASEGPRPKTGARVRGRTAARLAAVLGLLLAAACGGGGDDGGGGGGDWLVGAHYYVWYPSNFDRGYLRGALEPRQRPELGEYDSRDPAVAERHVALAAAHGIDFFTLSWWPDRPEQNAAIDAGFLRAGNLGGFRFCIFYDTLGLRRRSGPGIVFDEPTKARFVADLVEIGRRYFGHPSYLRVGGRPVVVVYVTRELHGLFPQAMREMRAALAAEGHDPFVIGDEVFWAVIADDEDPAAPARVTGEPQVSRIRLFDAITAYNLYESARAQDRGYGSESAVLRDGAALFRLYRDAGGVPLVPGVIPGYNDRATRLEADHFAIPRRFSPGAPEGSFLREAIERVAKPLADPGLRMVLLTSWNEWNEDTAIEPVAPAPETAADRAGGRITQGFAYDGYGNAYLEVVRDALGG